MSNQQENEMPLHSVDEEEVHHVVAGDVGASAEGAGEAPRIPTGALGDDSDFAFDVNAPSAPSDGPDFETAFVVVVDTNGVPSAWGNLDVLDGKTIRREPNLLDFKIYCGQVVDDVRAMEVVQRVNMELPAQVVGAIQKHASEMAQQMEAARIASSLHLPK